MKFLDNLSLTAVRAHFLFISTANFTRIPPGVSFPPLFSGRFWGKLIGVRRSVTDTDRQVVHMRCRAVRQRTSLPTIAPSQQTLMPP
jgi:hypothetical protein